MHKEKLKPAGTASGTVESSDLSGAPNVAVALSEH